MNLTLFFGFGASGSRREHLKFGLNGLCIATTKFWEMSRAASLDWLGMSLLPEFCLLQFDRFQESQIQKGSHFWDQLIRFDG